MSMHTDDDDPTRMVSLVMFFGLIAAVMVSSAFVWLVCTWIGLGFPWRDMVTLAWAVGYAVNEQRGLESAGMVWPWDERYRRR